MNLDEAKGNIRLTKEENPMSTDTAQMRGSELAARTAGAREKIVGLIEGVHGRGGWWQQRFPEIEEELWGLLALVDDYGGMHHTILGEWPPSPRPPVMVNLAAGSMDRTEVMRRVSDLEHDLRAFWPRPFRRLRRSLERLDEAVTAAVCD